MDIDTTANPAGGDDTRADITAAPDAIDTGANPADANTAADPALLEAPADPVEEFEEIERGDKKYRVPKELKGEFLMHADYTRKTMEVAEQRKALEQAKAQIEQAQALSTEERRAFARLEALNDQISQYEQVDWDTLEASDPQEAAKHWRTYQTALNQRNSTASALHQHEVQKAQRAQHEAAKRREEVETRLAKEVPNWSPAKRQELESFASQYGYTPDVLANTARVEDFQLLNLAHEGFKFIQRQKAAARAAAQSAVKPAPEVGGTAAAGIDPNNLSMEQYIALRQAGKL